MSRRRFNQSERNDLFFRASGACSVCGSPLDETWHADHVIPYAAGGPTHRGNGQALCRACNLSKGARMPSDGIQLRPHQSLTAEIMQRKIAHGERVFVGNIFPGSGKTAGYLNAANILYRSGRIDAAVVVVPRTNLAGQVEDDWNTFRALYREPRMGIMPHRPNVAPIFRANDQFGYVTTYASMLADPKFHEESLRGKRFMLVLDEAQQLGFDEKGARRGTQSADVMRAIGDRAEFVMVVTGTPVREDNLPLIYATYTQPNERGEQFLLPDVEATYRDGVDLGYLRRFDFTLANGRGQWESIDGDVEHLNLETMDSGIYKIINEPGYWEPMVDMTVERVRAVQQIDRRLCGLIGANNQRHAKAIEAYIRRRHAGVKTIIAVSDDADSQDKLRTFKRGNHDILITVAMAHVGFDHKPICVVCMLNDFRAHGWVVQFLGRGLRVLPGVEIEMHGICPPDRKAVEIFQWMRAESQLAMVQRERRERGERTDAPDTKLGQTTHAEMGEIRGLGNDTIVSTDEYRRIDEIRRKHHLEYVPATVLKSALHDLMGMQAEPVNESTPQPTPVDSPPMRQVEREKLLRDELNRELNRINSALMKAEYPEAKWGYAQNRVMAAFEYVPVEECNEDQLRERLDWVRSTMWPWVKTQVVGYGRSAD